MNPKIKKLLEILAWPFKQIWALFSDRQWHLDPYKIMGFVCYASGIYLSFKIFPLAGSLSDVALGILSSIVGGLFAGGTVMFSQARKADDTLPKE